MTIANEFCAAWRAMTAWQRRPAKCAHEFDYMTDMKSRDEAGQVSCRCHKCGEILKAECGLDLPGQLVQLRRNKA